MVNSNRSLRRPDKGRLNHWKNNYLWEIEYLLNAIMNITGGYTYENGSLKRILVDGGYIQDGQ